MGDILDGQDAFRMYMNNTEKILCMSSSEIHSEKKDEHLFVSFASFVVKLIGAFSRKAAKAQKSSSEIRSENKLKTVSRNQCNPCNQRSILCWVRLSRTSRD